MRTERLTDRLRGIYIIPVNDGAGLLYGKDTFTRHFETAPIQHEAAQVIDDLVAALKKAVQLGDIASDWNMPEVEIDGKMVRTYDLVSEFNAALAKAGAA